MILIAESAITALPNAFYFFQGFCSVLLLCLLRGLFKIVSLILYFPELFIWISVDVNSFEDILVHVNIRTEVRRMCEAGGVVAHVLPRVLLADGEVQRLALHHVPPRAPDGGARHLLVLRHAASCTVLYCTAASC